MTTFTDSFAHLSNHDLLELVKRLVADERQATARLIASLVEVDARRLYLGEGCSSLFTYCTQVLHLSEHAAYGRIEAARAARRFPRILELLADGAITLTTVGLLATHLTDANCVELLNSARHKSKREVEHLVAQIHPRPDMPSSVRKLPAAKTLAPAQTAESLGDEPSASVGSRQDSHELSVALQPTPKALAVPLAPERYKIQFTVGRETFEKLRRAQDLMRHSVPNGDPAALFDRALTVLLAELERGKLAAASRPRGNRPSAVATLAEAAAEAEAPAARRRRSRHIPAAVKRAVWTRDGGRCAFVGHSSRCTETGFLEFHHVVPYAAGGPAVVENIELRCAAHNAYEAEAYFGLRQPTFVRERAPTYGRRGLAPMLCQSSTRSGPDRAAWFFSHRRGHVTPPTEHGQDTSLRQPTTPRGSQRPTAEASLASETTLEIRSCQRGMLQALRSEATRWSSMARPNLRIQRSCRRQSRQTRPGLRTCGPDRATRRPSAAEPVRARRSRRRALRQ
jgi:hypothetical protein